MIVFHNDASFAADEMAVDSLRVAVLEAAQAGREHGVERVGDGGEQDVKVHLDEYGEGEGVEVEEFDGFGDAVLDAPAPGVVGYDFLEHFFLVVGDQEGGFLASVAADDYLSDFAVVAAKPHVGFVRLEVRVFSLRVGHVDFLQP